MVRLLQSHFIKSKRGIERSAYPLLPFLGVVLFIGIKLIWPSISDESLQRAFDYFFSIASLFCLGIVVPVHFQHELDTLFAYELRIGVSRTELWVSHCLYLIGIVVFEIILSYGLFIIIGNLFSIWQVKGVFILNGLSLIFYLVGTVLIYMLVSVGWGMSVTILLAAFLSLSAILLSSTDLGIGIWYGLPWVWPTKLAFQGYPTNMGLAMINITFVLMSLAFTSIWYNRWQGPRELEE